MFPAVTPRAQHLIDTLKRFVEEECIPVEARYAKELGEGADRWKNEPPVVEELRIKAKKLGLWNLFLPKEYKESPGLTNYEYGLMCETMGRCPLAAVATNCNAPNTGNMEVLAKYGNDAQKKKWLVPMMEGKYYSAFAMTEPAVPSSDATNISCKLSHTKGGYLINGKKWWISNSGHPKLKLFLVMVRSGKTNEELANSPGGIGLKDIHNQHSVVIVPSDTPGVRVGRPLHVFGYDHAPGGHCEVTFDNVFIPHENMILGEGRGFEIIQGRLGPGRLHHAMRTVGVAEKAFDIMIERAMGRVIQGQPLVEKGVIMDWIAKSRIEIDTARLLVLNASHAVDVKGARRSKKEIALAKIYVPNMALAVIDRAIQVHGAMGVCQDTPLAAMYANARTIRLADGPDEVHGYQIARNEIKIAKARLESKL
ncbi:hypothetical protein BB559_005790 [Furculomyces boomerangus]|uniref:Acyl-CoA dehydrogenase n=2 Tax=Harpellales TaxID=61421 RepID=A0A2T9Y6K2_9FUNG|nr:hypothetical protein BB559_005790 [Furculomyces boomerangus]PVZ99518.1 hypothetical protein BB558_004542 [Smittium angustum]